MCLLNVDFKACISSFSFFTKLYPLINFEKCFLFHLKCSFCSQDIQIFVILSYHSFSRGGLIFIGRDVTKVKSHESFCRLFFFLLWDINFLLTIALFEVLHYNFPSILSSQCLIFFKLLTILWLFTLLLNWFLPHQDKKNHNQLTTKDKKDWWTNWDKFPYGDHFMYFLIYFRYYWA